MPLSKSAGTETDWCDTGHSASVFPGEIRIIWEIWFKLIRFT